MINIWHLLWIIPTSAFAGAMALICFVCIAINHGAADEEERAEIELLYRRMEEDAKEHEEN